MFAASNVSTISRLRTATISIHASSHIVPLANGALQRWRQAVSTKPQGALQGDTAKARAEYQDFLTLWKDADPDIPILKEAKAEYAKLK